MAGRDSGSYPGAGENVTVFYSTDGMRSWKNQTALTITGTTWNTSVGKGRYVKEFFDVFWMEFAKTARKPSVVTRTDAIHRQNTQSDNNITALRFLSQTQRHRRVHYEL